MGPYPLPWHHDPGTRPSRWGTSRAALLRLLLARCLPLLAIASLAGIAGCSREAPPPGVVAGYVFGSTAGPSPALRLAATATPPAGYAPLAGAAVTVVGTRLAVITGEDGAFVCSPVPAGTRTAVVSCPGYRTVTATVTVRSRSITTVGEQLLSAVSRRWTVLLYVNGDNDLEHYALADLNEIEQVGGSGEVEVLAQLDRSAGYDSGDGNWAGARRYRLVRDGDPSHLSSPVLAQLGPVDMGSAASLADFVAWGRATLPADRYALVIWGHGDGWYPGKAPSARAVSIDETSGHSIGPRELGQALATAPVDLLLLDACLMSTLEVAHELAGGCRVLVASQGSPPATGYPYDRFIEELTDQPLMGPEQAGSRLADLLIEQQGDVVDAAVTDTAALPAVVTALDALAAAMQADPAVALPFEQARQAAPHGVTADDRDLAAIAGSLQATTVAGPAAELEAALAAAVLHRAGDRRLHGLSVYAPPPGTYLPAYSDLGLSRDTRWDEWLQSR